MGDSLPNVFFPATVQGNVVRFNGPHIGGYASLERLFGGQTAAQIEKAARTLHPECVVLTVKVNFIGPGNVRDPIDYVGTDIPETDFLIFDVWQNEKQIASGKIGRSSDLMQPMISVAPKAKNPLFYPTVTECMRAHKDDSPWTLLTFIANSTLFETRPIDFEHFSFQRDQSEPLVIWFRLRPPFLDLLPKVDGQTVAVMLSDFIVPQPAFINLIRNGSRGDMERCASLNHIVTFHTVDDIDPYGWFLYESSCNSHSMNRFLVETKIFDSKGKSLLCSLQEGVALKEQM
ncbi:hypothetical protein QR680_018080 [Steinernema hermaphroditum]|uniref:Acyl-CoA thioesterase-like C-terminal domain-containing protein n=1 Tax=Steinernema hermaphroditum TaxID=289476 RepID=A0AA39LQ93_9BILA|nr:hypothetical protein QR680_018080 [Steinernema hermaphroditum]